MRHLHFLFLSQPQVKRQRSARKEPAGPSVAFLEKSHRSWPGFLGEELGRNQEALGTDHTPKLCRPHCMGSLDPSHPNWRPGRIPTSACLERGHAQGRE